MSWTLDATQQKQLHDTPDAMHGADNTERGMKHITQASTSPPFRVCSASCSPYSRGTQKNVHSRVLPALLSVRPGSLLILAGAPLIKQRRQEPETGGCGGKNYGHAVMHLSGLLMCRHSFCQVPQGKSRARPFLFAWPASFEARLSCKEFPSFARLREPLPIFRPVP